MSKQRNLLTLLMLFERWLSVNDLSSGAQLLWFRLFAMYVKSYQPESISLSNAELATMLDCTERSVRNYRDKLVRNKLLIYESNGTRASGVYKLQFPYSDKLYKNKSGITENKDPNCDSDYGNSFPNQDSITENKDPNRMITERITERIRCSHFRNRDSKQAKTNALQDSLRREENSSIYIYNNTTTNTDNNTSNYKSIDSVIDIDADWLKVISLYQDKFGILQDGFKHDTLHSYYEQFGLEIVEFAINYVKDKRVKFPFQYLKAVLDNWSNDKLTTLEQIKNTVSEHNSIASHQYGEADELIKNGVSPFD